MNTSKKTLLPLVAVSAAISAFTAIAAEPTETTADAKAQPSVVEMGKGAPPAWVVASPETVKLAEAGDVDAMVEIANGYMELAMSPRINADDKEREAMRQEAMKWMQRRAKAIADREGDLVTIRKRAEAGDAAAQRNLGFRYSHGVDVEKDERKAFEWTKKAAEQGDARAQFILANDYAFGSGVDADGAEAIEWFKKAACGYAEMAKRRESFDLKPLLLTGQDLLDEEGDYRAFDPQWRKALGMGFLVIAARGGDATAMRELGEQFAMGTNTEEDLDAAIRWLRMAHLHGDKDAMDCMGRVRSIAQGRLLAVLNEKAKAGDREAEKTCREHLELFQKGRQGDVFSAVKAGAIIGYAPSQTVLGQCYMVGDGVASNPEEAVKWWTAAVNQGECLAMQLLAIAYEKGSGVAKDDWKALELLRRSDNEGWDPASRQLHSLSATHRANAEKGDASAQFFMGVAYEKAYGVERDFTQAAEWYRQAAEQGHVGAQTFWGYCLLQGQGVKKDEKSAAEWLRKAAKEGNSEAQLNYGRCLFYGEGVNKDETAAVSWYRKAADQGELPAMFNLGLCYLQGTGVEKDEAEAMKLFQEAAKRGHPGSVKLLKDLKYQ